MVCKLLHCEYRASEGANYQNMPLQCIVFSGLACSQHAIKLILVSDEADSRVDSNDSSPMCISCKTKKLFKLLLGSSQHEQSYDFTIAWAVHVSKLTLYGFAPQLECRRV